MKNKKQKLNPWQARLLGLENQVARLDLRIANLHNLSNRYAFVRLIVFIVELALVIAVFGTTGIWAGIVAIVVALVIFNVIAHFHRRVDSSLNRHVIWREIKLLHIARMKLDWAKLPPETAFATPISPRRTEIEVDLDITGDYSIHRLINTAAFYDSSERMRDWLVNLEPQIAPLKERQQLVQELAGLPLFRDRLTLLARLASSNPKDQWRGQKLLDWLKLQPSSPNLVPVIAVLSVLAALDIVLFILSRFAIVPNVFWVATFVIYVGIYNWRGGDTGEILDDAYVLKDGLDKLQAILKYLESYRYGNHARLKKLCQVFTEVARRPSVQLRRLAVVISAASISGNSIVWILLNAIVPWRFYVAFLLNRTKNDVSEYLPDWLDTIFELEALNSLATFSYLNPDYAFPQLQPSVSNAAPILEAVQIGHPLLSREHKICNDFELSHIGEIVIITGSNMAGKSSFLRTLGVNLCLAYAGGPVNAAQLQTTLFRLFTCIRISDSVTEGYSYFYAEVRRLRALLDELKLADQKLPIFFLVDEIFKGTNNRERLIGSRAVLQSLLGHNTTGLVSTHDLELVTLAQTSPNFQNYHFKEDVRDGQMYFSYKLQNGPSQSTNALKIMQLEGLPINLD